MSASLCRNMKQRQGVAGKSLIAGRILFPFFCFIMTYNLMMLCLKAVYKSTCKRKGYRCFFCVAFSFFSPVVTSLGNSHPQLSQQNDVDVCKMRVWVCEKEQRA